MTKDIHACEEESDFLGGSVGAIRAMNRIGVDAVSKIGTDSAFVGLLGVGGTHQVTVFQDGVFAFKHLNHDGARNHEIDQIFEERTGFVDTVKGFGFATAEMRHARGDDFEASAFKT